MGVSTTAALDQALEMAVLFWRAAERLEAAVTAKAARIVGEDDGLVYEVFAAAETFSVMSPEQRAPPSGSHRHSLGWGSRHRRREKTSFPLRRLPRSLSHLLARLREAGATGITCRAVIYEAPGHGDELNSPLVQRGRVGDAVTIGAFKRSRGPIVVPTQAIPEGLEVGFSL